MKKFIGFLVGVFIICLVVFSVREYKGQKPLPQKNETVQAKTVTVTISIPIHRPQHTEDKIFLNGVELHSPGWLHTFGKIEDLKCTNPHDMRCLVDRTAQVVGDVLNVTYNLPENVETNIGYEIGLELITANGITANGEPLTSLKVMGISPKQWKVACFIPWSDPDGKVHISNCPTPESSGGIYGTIENAACFDPNNTDCLNNKAFKPTDNISINSINGVPLTSFNQLGQNQYGLVCFRVSKKRLPNPPPLEEFLKIDFDPIALALKDFGLGEERVYVEGVDAAKCTDAAIINVH